MDFGVVVGFDVLGASSDPETNKLGNKRYGSGFLKQERSGASTVVDEEDDWGSSKLAKTGIDSNSNSMMRSNTTLFSSEGHQQPQMLSFSCPKSEQQNSTLPNYCHYPYSAYNNRPGYNSGGGGGMHGVLTGVRGPFSPSQWMELEHQALIYKYITANVPIPSNLLIPIRKALDSAAFSGALLRPNPLGWGSFHVGFSGMTDPEPGRCRRTDGKKWRCSRDAVADQKYCERHMNRGRHRSRKPVEGQAASSPATSMAKLMPAVSSSPASGAASNSLAIAQQQQQLKNLHPPASSNRMYMNKEDNVSDPKSKDNPFFIPKQQNPYEDTSRAEFGLVPSDSLLNPSNKSSTLMNYKDSEAQHSLRQFMDDWPKNHSDRSVIAWPDLDMQPDRTQLSISIPNNEKVAALSPLRLSREFDPVQMGLGVGGASESSNRQANWVPISWETTMGGPLGEVLHNTNNNSAMECKNSSSALNLMTEGWDNSPPLGSSPTGVLQKTAFGSLSNSSAGSSPRAHEGASLCNDLLGTTLVSSTISERY